MTTVGMVPSKPATLTELMAERHHLSSLAFLNAIRATVFKEGSNEQLCAFLMVAEKYDLDPLTREIYAVAAKGGGIIPIVPIDGWAKKVNEHPQFDGFEFRDTFDENKRIVSITCKMFRKDRSRPGEITEYLSECARDTEPWRKWPVRMLRWKTYIQCARVTFGLSGIYDSDEAARIDPSLGAVIEAQEYANSTGGTIGAVVTTSPYDKEIDALFAQLRLNDAQQTLLRNRLGGGDQLVTHLRERLGSRPAQTQAEPQPEPAQSRNAKNPPEDKPEPDDFNRVVPAAEKTVVVETPDGGTSAATVVTGGIGEPRRRGRPTREEIARKRPVEPAPEPQPEVSEQDARRQAETLVADTDTFAF